MAAPLTSSVEGLVVSLSDGGYRKERAALDGLFYWDRDNQNIILTHLGGVLPKVREAQDSGVFSLVLGGKEACGSSSPLGKTKLPSEIFHQIEVGLDGLRRQLERDDLTPEARLVIEKFALPDPERLPEFYRTFSRNKEPQLLIIWGCNHSKTDFIPPADALAKLPREGTLGRFLRKSWPFLLGLLALAFIVALVLVYFALPVFELTLSKETAAPHEPIRVNIKTVKGQSFSFTAPEANIFAAKPAGRLVDGQIADWDLHSPVESVDFSFPEVGRYEVRVVGQGNFFGITLPPVTAKKAISIMAADTLPPVTPRSEPETDAIIIASGPQVRIQLLTPTGHIPAQISVTSNQPGSLHFAGSETQIVQGGIPKNLPPVGKPGLYRAKFSGEDGAEEQHFVQITEAGGPPLVANIRPNRKEVGVHESLLFDASSSMVLDPEARITSKEISLDGGANFEPMTGEFHVTSFHETGQKAIVLKIKDDKGREATDTTSVKVVASESPKPIQLTSETFSPVDITDGASFSIPEGILFEPGRAHISPRGQQLLTEFAHAVASQDVVVLVVGHTDNLPIRKGVRSRFVDNQQLSEARAQSAVDILATGGVKKENLRSKGIGDALPIFPNTTEEGRSQNRRIEISIIGTAN